MPTRYEPVRETLAESRRAGEVFADAWPRALEVASPEDRRALEATPAAVLNLSQTRRDTGTRTARFFFL